MTKRYYAVPTGRSVSQVLCGAHSGAILRIELLGETTWIESQRSSMPCSPIWWIQRKLGRMLEDLL